jgi:hypothetical protein
VAEAVGSLGVSGRIAAITAGWEEREEEDSELEEHLEGRTVNLRLFQRAERVFEQDPELFEAMRSRYDTLRELQAIYRLRLEYALGAARDLLARGGDADLLEPAREAAIDSVRRLDAHHAGRVAEINAGFEHDWRPGERESVAREREEVAGVLAGCEALCIAGGHVAILLNRMRLFDPLAACKDKPIVAWSAGAMVLAERIVLFHDSPPQGAGNAEVLGGGLGHCRGLLPLPHASARLRLGDATRVGLLARRFRPDLCVALDQGARIETHGKHWIAAHGTRRLGSDGQVVEVAA